MPESTNDRDERYREPGGNADRPAIGTSHDPAGAEQARRASPDARTGTADGPDSARVPARWEREVLEKLVMSSVVERRRSRRWAIALRLLTLAWLTGAILLFSGWLDTDVVKGSTRHTALVEIDGVISSSSENSADELVSALKAAFSDTRTAGVVLRINSPGGSPVQAGIVHDEILRLRAGHPDKPLYAVIDEVCASGGYYVAVAADRIYVDKASLVGSIGVLMNGFGFTGAMDKLGIERRLITAGDNKGFLDSFSPLSDEQREHAQLMVDEIHGQFIDVVRKGRAERLVDEAELFSGLVWTGARSIELGLTDAIGTVDSVAREVIKAEQVVDFSPRSSLAEQFARRIGAGAGETLARVLGLNAGRGALH